MENPNRKEVLETALTMNPKGYIRYNLLHMMAMFYLNEGRRLQEEEPIMSPAMLQQVFSYYQRSKLFYEECYSLLPKDARQLRHVMVSLPILHLLVDGPSFSFSSFDIHCREFEDFDPILGKLWGDSSSNDPMRSLYFLLISRKDVLRNSTWNSDVSLPIGDRSPSSISTFETVIPFLSQRLENLPSTQLQDALDHVWGFEKPAVDKKDLACTLITIYLKSRSEIVACSYCGKTRERPMHSCPKCQAQWYCKDECRKRHWPLHSLKCNFT
jgi:hypothetical protein